MPELNEYAIIADDIIERCRKLGETQPDRIGTPRYIHTETKVVPKIVKPSYVKWDEIKLDDWVCTTEVQERDTPACIMGQALVELGVEPSQLRKNLSILYLLKRMGISATEQEKQWLFYCQCWHDQGKTWAQAVRLADRGAPPPLPPNPPIMSKFINPTAA